MLLFSTLILSSYSIIVVMLGCDWGLRMVINITCFKIPGSGFIFAASEYPSMTNEGFNDWGGRGYDDFVPGELTKTVPSGDRTT